MPKTHSDMRRKYNYAAVTLFVYSFINSNSSVNPPRNSGNAHIATVEVSPNNGGKNVLPV